MFQKFLKQTKQDFVVDEKVLTITFLKVIQTRNIEYLSCGS